ncbi:MAG: DinB family protein [Bacteroidetes bacterium]|nr:DinB family protein [Bacteroidota bacterium]
MFKTKSLLFSIFAVAILLVLTHSVSAQNAPSDIVIVNEFVGQTEFIQGRLSQLAEAMPENTFGWRPTEGVRSVSEVYLHAAFANYICVTMSGGSVPDEVGFVMDFSKANDWDTQTTDKAAVVEKLNQSFDILKKRIGELNQEDLDREVEVFGMTMSVRNFMISMIAHSHEHLGQGIAYARMNDVTPPWSEKQEGEGEG